ncbi:MAG: hypothetical protein NWT08_05710 [Akkermansiaceae bacterium]|jgi:hypothetical protein|nr:hypothetical protein [Akkermansiaceae bacterium]MDP4645746.1 hypothetical protein [Akkermansiaceae bacterium]MDP4781503.1 hypothetical protein [Akkermansiaceae bacterium]
MSMPDGLVKINLQGQVMEGTTEMETVEKRRVESLENGSYRYLVIDEVEKQTMTLMGQAQPMPPKVNPLVGIPVIVTKGADGVWVANLEEGEVTPETVTKLDDIADGLNDDEDAKLYGTEPRKVGDEWEVESADLMGVENGKGVFKLKFESIEEHEGVRCAKITGNFEIKGTEGEDEGEEGADEMTITLTGDYLAYRSLEGRYDVSKKMDGSMSVKGDMEPQPGMTMQMDMTGKIKADGTVRLIEGE